MLKYCLKCFDPDGNLFIQIICNPDELKENITILREFGIVKGFVIDGDENV